MKLKTLADYEVLYQFEAIPNLKRLSYKEAKEYAQENYPGCAVLLELISSTINIMPPEIDSVKMLMSFINRLNILSAQNQVAPQLFDAGYIPYIFTPSFMMNNPIVPREITDQLRLIAKKSNITCVKHRGPYFVGGNSTQGCEWITRKDAAKLINLWLGYDKYNVEDDSVTDRITTTDVLSAILTV